MSSLSDFLGGGGGGLGGAYTASTAVAGTKLTANKAYPIANDGKIYDIDGGAFARTAFDSLTSTNTAAELGTLARATTGGATLGASADLHDAESVGNVTSDYNTKFLPDGITEVDLYIEDQNTGDVYLTLSQNATSFANVGVLFENGNNLLGDYKIINLPEDTTHYYLAIFAVTYSNYTVSPSTNHYVIVSVAKSDFTVTVLETLVNADSDTLYTGQWNTNGERQLHRTVNFFSARNGTVFLSTRANYSDTSNLGTIQYDWGTHETGAGRTRAIDSGFNSNTTSVTDLATTGWLASTQYPFQVFKISDADGTFLTFGNTTTSGTLKAQLLTLDAAGTLTAADLTISGSTTNLDINDRRYGKLLQTSTSTKFVHFGNILTNSMPATVVTLDPVAETLTFSATTDTVTGLGTEQAPALGLDFIFLHGRDHILTTKHNALNVDPTDFSVPASFRTGVQGEVFNRKSASGLPYDTVATSTDDYMIYPGSNDYTAVGLGPNPNDPDTVANLYVDYLKLEDITSIVQTNSSIALVLADTEAGATATIELASGDVATTTLDSTKFLTKEGMVYPFSNNTDGVISSPATIPSIRSVQQVAFSDTGSLTYTLDIATVNPEKTYIADWANNTYHLNDYTLTANTLELTVSNTSAMSTVLTLVEGI